jgi:hypothetical protein
MGSFTIQAICLVWLEQLKEKGCYGQGMHEERNTYKIQVCKYAEKRMPWRL